MARRSFLAATVTSAVALTAAEKPKPITQASVPEDPNAPKEQPGTVASESPFAGPLSFSRNDFSPLVRSFPLKQVKLLPSSFLDAQEANHKLLLRYDADRLLHTFRINAALPSNATPLGGWEKPECELRGHFVGHYLSACALMYSATGDARLKEKAAYLVSELAKCQDRLGNGYLSAFPTELFVRLKERKKVWAPFYTYHKILAGMLDVNQHCANAQALAVAEGMARWVDSWTSDIPLEHMQMVLDEEFGGMNEALYNLAAITGNPQYAIVGDRFTKQRFFNPLALQQDRLRGLHTNTHIPQVIGAARRYELTSDTRFHDVAQAFFRQVVLTRSYATGGTSNNEGWLTDPNHTADEMSKGTNSNECCCAYNMLKLARQLYTWEPDPRIFDYYERILYNHRLGTIDKENGHTQYYLGVVPGSWRTFGTEDTTFWCCNGTGVEEYSKLADSIYFESPNKETLYVNLFIPSELNWAARDLHIRQTNRFPDTPATRIEVSTKKPQEFALQVRIPSWVAGFAKVSVNGKASDLSAAPGSYLVLNRTWHNGDAVEVQFPANRYSEHMPDDRTVTAFFHGPLLLASRIEGEQLPESAIIGPMGPKFTPAGLPPAPPAESLIPFNTIKSGERYSIYFKVS